MPDPFLVLLDRDGTINIDRHYLADPDGLEFLPGAVEGLQTLRDAGAVFAIVTNQSGVGRGFFDRAAADAVNARLVEMLGEHGVEIAFVGLCPHAPEDACDCRKPAPRLALEAATATGLPLDQAWVIGDKTSDTGLADAVGARGVLIAPDGARDLVEAARIILDARTGQAPV
jgi:histidinol-phosphate phosphatase family protein